MKGVEEAHAEPIADTYSHVFFGASVVMYDSAWQVGEEAGVGDLTLGLEPGAPNQIRGWILEIRDKNRTVLHRASHAIRSRFTKQIAIPWVRTPIPPRTDVPKAFWGEVARQDRRVETQGWRDLPGGTKIRGVALLCDDEIAYRQKGNGWLFAFTVMPPANSHAGLEYRIVRPGPGWCRGISGPVSLNSSRFSDKAVAVFGLGCVGSAVALEFARAGVGELRILRL